MILSEKWFVLGPEGPVGPVSIDQLRRGLAAGKVPSDAVIAPEGSPAWSPIEEVLAELARKDRLDIESALAAPSVASPPDVSPSRAPGPPRPAPRPPPSRKSAETPTLTEDDLLGPPLSAPVVVPAATKTDPRPVSDTSLIPAPPASRKSAKAPPALPAPPISIELPAPSVDALPVPAAPTFDTAPEAPPSPREALDVGAQTSTPLPPPAAPPRSRPVASAATPRASDASEAASQPRATSATSPLLVACAVVATALLGATTYRSWVPRSVDRAELAKEASLVLQKHEGAKRAARCESALGELDELSRGKPFVVERTTVPDLCRAVSKGRPGHVQHGGFVLSAAAECGHLETALPRDLGRHEAGLQAVVNATCDAQKKPTAAPDDAAKLAAQASLDALFPRLVRSAAAGGPTATPFACYDDLLAAAATTAGEERRLRCAVLRSRAGTALPATTVLQRSGLDGAYEAYGREHATTLAALRAQDREADLVESFLASAEARACATSTTATAEERVWASSRAVVACLGGPGSLD